MREIIAQATNEIDDQLAKIKTEAEVKGAELILEWEVFYNTTFDLEWYNTLRTWSDGEQDDMFFLLTQLALLDIDFETGVVVEYKKLKEKNEKNNA